MYHDRVGEFWYQLQMSADPPAPTMLPVMECELGRWTRQDIVLDVPSEEIISVEPIVSNPNNFILEYNVSSLLEITAGCPLILPLTFVPSMLCTGDQTSTIVFRSQQVCDWRFQMPADGNSSISGSGSGSGGDGDSCCYSCSSIRGVARNLFFLGGYKIFWGGIKLNTHVQ